MRISHFFIERPIFACVVSAIFVILGGVAYVRLPVAQYPEIAPPVINITGQYFGAGADVVATTVVAPLEEQINGVENMLYMASNSTADGRFSIDDTLLYEHGVRDFDKYRVDPSSDLAPDFFVPDSIPPPPGVSLTARKR